MIDSVANFLYPSICYLKFGLISKTTSIIKMTVSLQIFSLAKIATTT